jgi:YesN/AraC family two-component response regulator
VLEASNGPDAVELARKHQGPIHLLLTDVVMPAMLGPEVAERVNEVRPEAAVLYMSGYSQPAFGPGGLAEDVHLIDKPFSASQLLTRVRQLLEGGRSLTA